MDIEAKKVSVLTGADHPTIHKIFDKIRPRTAEACERNSLLNSGEIELDERYFGAKRVRGKRRQGAGGKMPVLGMLEEKR